MTKDKKVRRISAVFAAAGLVVLTVFGVAGADEPYNDSNVGISSAFEIYADAQAAKEESVQMASAVDSADGNDSDGSPDGQAVSQDTSSETESDSKEDSDRTAADTQKQAADEEKNGSTDVTETAQDQTSDDTDAEETEGQAAVASAETADGVSQEDDEVAAVSQSSGQTQYPQFEGQCIAVADDYVNVRAEADINSEVVGIIPAAGVASVVEIGDEWTKVTSGSCEGYINNAYLAYGDDAGRYAEANCSKQATVTTETLNVRAEADVSSDCVTLVGQGQSFDVLSEEDGWYEISVDAATSGYISADYAEVTYDLESAVTIEELQAELETQEETATEETATEAATEEVTTEAAAEETTEAATEEVTTEAAAEETTEVATEETTTEAVTEEATTETASEEVTTEAATEETTETVTEEVTTEAAAEEETPASSGQTGVDVANYATQFVGNPYVYGGSSLTEGADCSGFVMAVYAEFGYSLPHSAGAQSGCGTSVDISDLEAGDIVFYGDGSIEHCAIYIGGGMIVHASTVETGIKISSYDYRTPICAVRIIGQ